jgi:membrane protein DedA with SNARE-associated domain
MSYLFELVYWFNSKPEPISRQSQKLLASIITILLILAIIILIRVYGEKMQAYKPTLKKLLPFCFGNALIGLYLIFVNYEVIPILRARFWFLIWLVIIIIWIIAIIKDYIKRKRRKEEAIKEQEIKKYLP